MLCPRCGQPAGETFKFCDRCGLPLAPPAETRTPPPEPWAPPRPVSPFAPPPSAAPDEPPLPLSPEDSPAPPFSSAFSPPPPDGAPGEIPPDRESPPAAGRLDEEEDRPGSSSEALFFDDAAPGPAALVPPPDSFPWPPPASFPLPPLRPAPGEGRPEPGAPPETAEGFPGLQPKAPESARPLSLSQVWLMELIGLIPVVNLVVFLVMALGGGQNLNRARLAQAKLLTILLVIIALLAGVLAVAALIAAGIVPPIRWQIFT